MKSIRPVWMPGLVIAVMVVSCTKSEQPLYPARDFVYSETGSMLPVIYSHEKHIALGLTCDDCHPAIFEMRLGMADATKKFNMKSIYEGKYCGACHDSEKAFGLEKCSGCHIGSHM